jgi:hypothetical protein
MAERLPRSFLSEYEADFTSPPEELARWVARLEADNKAHGKKGAPLDIMRGPAPQPSESGDNSLPASRADSTPE